MMEILPKLSGFLKTMGFSLFVMSITSHQTDKLNVKEKGFAVDDDVPGDNFPFIVMKDHRIK